MKIIKATLSDAGKLADMNKRLIEDERHPNPMNLAQLTQRMSSWLQNDTPVTWPSKMIILLLIVFSVTNVKIIICDNCMLKGKIAGIR